MGRQRLVRSIAALWVLWVALAALPLARIGVAAAAAVAPAAPATAVVPDTAAARPVLDAIGFCINRLNPGADVGYERIAARCPGLVHRLEESGWSLRLPRDWRRPGNDLSAGGLRELCDLILASTVIEPVRAPSVDTLPAVLAAVLAQQNGAREGWWARTRVWVREMFERRQDEDEDGLSHFVAGNGVPESVLELLSYVGLTLVVVLAAVIVGNELRAAGVIGRLRRRFGGRATTPRRDVMGGGDPGDWDDVRKAAPAQRPRLLLERVVARLAAQNRLPSPRGLTIHELTQAAQLADESDRRRLNGLAWMAERVRFSNEAIPDEAIAAVVESGQSLLERIAHYPQDPHQGRPHP